MRRIVVLLILALAQIGTAEARDASKGSQFASKERAQYCATKHESDFYAGWVKNHCNKAPFGARFEYLRPAWDCLCLGTE